MKRTITICKIILALTILWAIMTGAGETEDGGFSPLYTLTCLAIIWAAGYIWRRLSEYQKNHS